MGALLKLPFFTTDRENEFFAILDLTFHSWSPNYIHNFTVYYYNIF